MFGLEPTIVAWLSLSIFIGGLAKGLSGVALPITTLAIALNFVDARTGLALLAVPILMTNIWQAFGTGDIFGPLKRFWFMAVVFVFALYVGSLLVSILDEAVLFAMMGTSSLIFVCSQIYKPNSPALSPNAERILGPIAGALGGVMGGLTSVWGPPIIMFLFSLKLDKYTWVRSVTGLYLIGAIPLVFFYVQNGVLDGDMLWLSFAACVPVMVGILIGERARKHINEEAFRKFLLIVLLIVGVNMLRRAIM